MTLPPRGKQVPKSKLMEWKGLDRIAPVIHSIGCIWREQEKDDVGVDGEIELCTPREDGDGYRATGKIIKVQAKSGNSYIRSEDDASFYSPVREKDLYYWRDLNLPVIFIVFHPDENKLYWKDLKGFLRETEDVFSKPYKIPFDKEADRFDQDSAEQLFELFREGRSRVADAVVETLHSNALEISSLPDNIYKTKVLPEKRPNFHQRLEGFRPPYVFFEGSVLTLTPPRKEPNALQDVIEGETEEMEFGAWYAREPKSEHHLRHLIGRLVDKHLYDLGLDYNHHLQLHYFNDESLEEDSPIEAQWTSSLSGRSPTRKVAKYKEYAGEGYFRHHAVEVYPWNDGLEWAIVLTPRYFYSTDGKTRWKGDSMRSVSIRDRQREYNRQYLNHVLFWAYTISNEYEPFDLSIDSVDVVSVDGEPTTVDADFGLWPNFEE